MSPHSRLSPIVLVDDSADDRFFVRRLLQKSGVKNPVLDFDEGNEAIAYLRNLLGPEVGPLPCVILTDLKMPGADGFELLAWVRSHAAFNGSTVVVLSDSGAPRDRKRAKALGADKYFVKLPAAAVLADIVAEHDAPRAR
jgi:CheY-like chemotaxis protein